MTDSAHPLDALFRPRSIAVVGASPNPDKIGHVLTRNLKEFEGKLYPVHPSAAKVIGRRAFATVSDIPAPVDLALLAIPPGATMAALEDCAKAEVRAAVIYSGGWAEVGGEGAEQQHRLREFARAHGIRLLGPNTSGFLVPHSGLFATFVADLPDSILPGALAIVAQSGGVNLNLCFHAQSEAAGVRLGIGLGNAADVGLADVLDWLADDDETGAIALAIEGVPDGMGLVQAVNRVVDRKPVVAMTLGRTDVTAFAQSHTGALTGSYRVKRAALAQAGAVVVDTLTELIDAAIALTLTRLAPLPEPGVGVVTAQAGPGLILTDALHAHGVKIPPLDPETRQSLKELLPPLTYQENPVDTGRPTGTFPKVLETVIRAKSIDMLAVSLLHEPNAVDPVDAFRRATPAVLHSQGPTIEITELQSKLMLRRIPIFPTPERAADAVAALVRDAVQSWQRFPEGSSEAAPPAPQFKPFGGLWDEVTAKTLLDEMGIRTPERRICRTRSEAHTALRELGGPLAVKVLSPRIHHKTELGGVHLDISDPARLDIALDAIDRIDGAQYLLERMIPPGPELFVGVRYDISFGPMVVLGSGGTDVELESDLAIRLAPVPRSEAEAMLSELASAKRYRGFRGAPAVDEQKLVEILIHIGQVAISRRDIAELEINPLRVTQNGLIALDALVIPK